MHFSRYCFQILGQVVLTNVQVNTHGLCEVSTVHQNIYLLLHPETENHWGAEGGRRDLM